MDKIENTFLHLHSVEPAPFNPNFDMNYNEISDEAHRRTREAMPANKSRTNNEYHNLYMENYKKVKEEMESRSQT